MFWILKLSYRYFIFIPVKAITGKIESFGIELESVLRNENLRAGNIASIISMKTSWINYKIIVLKAHQRDEVIRKPNEFKPKEWKLLLEVKGPHNCLCP